MTGLEFHDAMVRLGLSVSEAGPCLFGVGPTTSRRWSAGIVPVPPLVEKVTLLLLSGRLQVRDLWSPPKENAPDGTATSVSKGL